jgi:hypothetical protein
VKETEQDDPGQQTQGQTEGEASAPASAGDRLIRDHSSPRSAGQAFCQPGTEQSRSRFPRRALRRNAGQCSSSRTCRPASFGYTGMRDCATPTQGRRFGIGSGGHMRYLRRHRSYRPTRRAASPVPPSVPTAARVQWDKRSLIPIIYATGRSARLPGPWRSGATSAASPSQSSGPYWTPCRDALWCRAGDARPFPSGTRGTPTRARVREGQCHSVRAITEGKTKRQ